MKFIIQNEVSKDQFKDFVSMHRSQDVKVTNVTVGEQIQACCVGTDECYMFTSNSTAAGKVAANLLAK